MTVDRQPADRTRRSEPLPWFQGPISSGRSEVGTGGRFAGSQRRSSGGAAREGEPGALGAKRSRARPAGGWSCSRRACSAAASRTPAGNPNEPEMVNPGNRLGSAEALAMPRSAAEFEPRVARVGRPARSPEAPGEGGRPAGRAGFRRRLPGGVTGSREGEALRSIRRRSRGRRTGPSTNQGQGDHPCN
jgi:hypothetical protein